MEGSSTGFSVINDNGAVEQMVHPSRTWRTKCFEAVDRWFSRLVRFMTAWHEGFWLGFLSANDLNVLTAEHYAESKFFLSVEHNLSGLFDWEASALDRYFRRGSRILVAAAGAGREVLALRKIGFDAEGFECNLALVRVSERIFEQEGESKHVVACEADCVPPGPQIYDGLIVGWTAYTHIPTRLRRVSFLRDLRQRALPHSPVLISFFARTGGSREESLVYRIATLCRYFLRVRKEPLELGDRISYARFSHWFTEDEVVAELRAAGFRAAHCKIEEDSGNAIGIAE